MEMQATSGLDHNAKPFVHPPVARMLARFSLVFCVAGCLFALALPFLRPGGDNRLLIVSCLVGFGSCLYLSIGMVRGTRETVVITDEGLRCDTPGRPAVFIPWEDVDAVYPQNVMQRLVVEDRSGTRSIHIEFHLQDFGELRRIILERATRRRTADDEASAALL